MHDVARRSGVSIATVSNVLHDTAPVAEATRRRVLEAIDELGYRSNEVARSLKRRSTRTRASAPWLKTTLVQTAWAATRKKDSYFHAQFLRLKTRRGPKKAILAVAASMLTDVYYMLRDGVEFHDAGDQYFVQQEKDHVTKRLLRRLKDLGVEVEVKTHAA